MYLEVWWPANGDSAAGRANHDPEVRVDMFVKRFVVKESPDCSKIMTDKLSALCDRFTRKEDLVHTPNLGMGDKMVPSGAENLGAMLDRTGDLRVRAVAAPRAPASDDMLVPMRSVGCAGRTCTS